MNDAAGIDIAGSDDVSGPGERVGGQQRECGSRRSEFGIGGGGKKMSLVQAVDGLPLERSDADTPRGVAQSWISKDGVDAVGDWAFDGRRMRRTARLCREKTG